MTICKWRKKNIANTEKREKQKEKLTSLKRDILVVGSWLL